MKIIVMKKRTIFMVIAAIFAILLIAIVILGVNETKAMVPLDQKKVVIDVGHGGRDDGVVGSLGTKESELNLIIATKLKNRLEKAGIYVVLTREDNNGLYDNDATNKKKSDMEKRKEIIQNVNPDMLISIHANRFPADKSVRGAQVFYDEFNKEGNILSGKIQENLNILNKENTGKCCNNLSGDYFVLKCTTNPAVLIECGFLSNEEDEKLLISEKYQDELTFSIYSGIVAYLEGK